MDRLFHPLVLSRILDSEVKVTPPAEPFSLGLPFTALQDSIWAETNEHQQLPQVVAASASAQDSGHGVRDSAVPEDAQKLSRRGLISLRGQLQGALNKPGIKMSVETRAHLSESVARIDEALKANMQRTSF